jgi:hypothetical protein
MAIRIVFWLALFALAASTLSGSPAGAPRKNLIVTVRVRAGRPLQRFIPSHALGAAVDGHDKDAIDRQLTAANIHEMLSAGFKSLAYRLRTELAVDAWHWNPEGAWSEPGNKRGYWTSETRPGQPIWLSYGYSLPRRGNTIDQADNTGYSRLDDADTTTFWKSNPYLDQHFTREANSRHPQWIVVDLGSRKKVNAARLLWGNPFATRYEIQYADFDDISDICFNPPGMWRTFPRRKIVEANDGEILVNLSSHAIETRFVRILMTESSVKSPQGSTDVRDALGFAMREVYLGRLNKNGEFTDEVQHSDNHDRQTTIYVSSTDPWHREIDRDESTEQPGLDRIFQSGLTNELPMLTPIPLLYDAPENAAAEIQYLKAKGYLVDRVELGEEPDGQYVTPEDYGALYLQFADVLHKVDPKLQLGGPSFQEIMPDQTQRREKLGNSAWLGRFRKYLKVHGRLQDYSFFSFEWYPFDDVCDPVAPQLARATGMMTSALKEMESRGLSRSIPWIISEYGYSAFASRAEIGIEGALLNADIVGRFLSLGGDQCFLYGYTPAEVAREVDCTAGNNMLFAMDREGNITHHFATYFAAQLLTEEWLQPSNRWHEMYPVTLSSHQKKGESLVTAYAVYRPDELWSLLLINKDSQHDYRVWLQFRSELNEKTSAVAGPLDLYQFSGTQYQLSNDEDNPYPIRSRPPVHRVLEPDKASAFELPTYSITVIRGHGPSPRLRH